MRKPTKTLLAILVLIIVGGAGFHFGQLSGFSQGIKLDRKVAMRFSAVNEIRILKILKEGKIDEAIKRLEIEVDADIVESDLLEGQFKADEYTKLIADYRKEFPPKYMTSENKRKLNIFVDKYGTK